MEQVQTEKKDLKKEYLREWIYRFSPVNKSDFINITGKNKLFLVVNGNITDIGIEKLFINIPVVYADEIKGYSILQMMKGKSDSKIKLDSKTTVTVTFIDKLTNKEFFISDIYCPFVQDYDKEISYSQLFEIVNLLINAASVTTSNNDVITNTKEQEAKAKAEQEAKAKAEAEAKAKAEEEKRNVLGGLDWENERKDYIDNNFIEYKFGDYRFFHRNGETPEGEPEVDLYLLVEGDYLQADLSIGDIEEDKETYLFEDEEGAEYLLLFNKDSGKISIRENE